MQPLVPWPVQDANLWTVELELELQLHCALDQGSACDQVLMWKCLVSGWGQESA